MVDLEQQEHKFDQGFLKPLTKIIKVITEIFTSMVKRGEGSLPILKPEILWTRESSFKKKIDTAKTDKERKC